jgi:hypothetical protein
VVVKKEEDDISSHISNLKRNRNGLEMPKIIYKDLRGLIPIESHIIKVEPDDGPKPGGNVGSIAVSDKIICPGNKRIGSKGGSI